MRSRAARALFVLLGLSLAACSGGAGTQTPRSPTPSPTPTLAPSPTPFIFTVVSGLNAVPSPDGDGWTLIGLVTNRSNFIAGEVWVRATIDGPTGEPAGEEEVAAAIGRLGPGESSPFAASFPGVTTPTGAHAEVVRYTASETERPEVEVTGLRMIPTTDGRTAVVGNAINRSGSPIEFRELAVWAADEAGVSLALSSASVHRPWLDPGAQSPFLAILPAGVDEAQLMAFADASVAPETPTASLTFDVEPMPLEDEQGDPFVLGVIRNPENRPRWASVLVRLSSAGEVVGVGQVVTTVPLGPGESRAFTITGLPGLSSATGVDIETLNVEAWLDPLSPPEAVQAAVPLGLQVTSYEAIAGTLFLQGTVVNDTNAPVTSVTVMGAVRSLEGEPLTAGWRVVAETLDAGASVDFVVELTLPRGADVVMSEYDVIAVGLAPAE